MNCTSICAYVATIIVFTTGCTSTFKNKTYQSMAIGSALGILYGSSKPKDQGAYATMYGALGAASGAVYSTIVNDPDAELDKSKTEITALKRELDEMSSPKVEKQTTALFGNRVPDKYKALINPGEWRVSKLDQWIEDDENRLIHQDLIMELTPPTLVPIQKSTNRPEVSK